MSKDIQTIQVVSGQRICCPTPEHTSWNQHPRVYIDFNDQNKGVCPYCGANFIVSDDITVLNV